MQRRHVDISELYDLFQERKDCFFVLCDIKHMLAINDISIKAGDLAILEQMRRMTAASGEDDIVFRIGGDEFCILTASSDAAYAEQIAEKIRSMNEYTFSYESREIPLTLHVTAISLKECNCYEEVFAGLHNAIRESKA
ncbi:MAG: GGDEF domain-containing protein [Bacteroidales bacterium]|nr:GGDEF domain-containing protein [Bacteroidales bacterium]MCM1423397.1 GGDEF domain-containing protein [bacterium]